MKTLFRKSAMLLFHRYVYLPAKTPVTTVKLDPAECTIKNWNFSCLKGAKLASTWYNNVNGYTETQTVKACIMNIGHTGPAECMTEWYNGDCIARPILAF